MSRKRVFVDIPSHAFFHRIVACQEKMYDPHVKLAYLKSTWISQASARQRKGRAGRTRAGVCFHLFSKRRHASFPEFQDSEILRMPLEELVLQSKQLGLAPGRYVCCVMCVGEWVRLCWRPSLKTDG